MPLQLPARRGGARWAGLPWALFNFATWRRRIWFPGVGQLAEQQTCGKVLGAALTRLPKG